MKIRNMLLASAAVLLSTASISAATAVHTWVSGSGNDNSACTFADPCLTLNGALAKTTAGGLITAKDAVDFGAVNNLTQSVTIDGSNLGSITSSKINGIPIYIQATANVTVQNLTINGGGAQYGIFVEEGGTLTVDNCRITNVIDGGIYFIGAGNLTVVNSRIGSLNGTGGTGIGVADNAAENVVVRNTVIDASPLSSNNNGFMISSNSGTTTASLQNVTITGAGNFAVLTQAGTTQITGSVITQSNYGVYAVSGATVSVASSLITANNTGVYSATGSKIRLDNNDIYDNAIAIGNGGGIVKTSTTNKTSGTIAIPAADISNSVTF